MTHGTEKRWEQQKFLFKKKLYVWKLSSKTTEMKVPINSKNVSSLIHLNL